MGPSVRPQTMGIWMWGKVSCNVVHIVIGVSINKIKLYTVLVSAVAVLSTVCVLIGPATVIYTGILYVVCCVSANDDRASIWRATLSNFS